MAEFFLTDSSLLLNCPSESLSQDISGGDGVVAGHGLLGLLSSGRWSDLGVGETWLSISALEIY